MEIIVTTDEKLEKLISKCFRENFPKEPAYHPQSEPVYLHSISELATFLRCSNTTAQKIKNSGKIRFSQFGRKVVFNADHVLEDLGKKKR